MLKFHDNVLSRFPRTSDGGAHAGYAGCFSGPYRREHRKLRPFALTYAVGVITGAVIVLVLIAMKVS